MDKMKNALPPFLEEILLTGEMKYGESTTKVLGFSNRNNLILLKNLIKKFRGKKTLEIGLAFGGSASIILHVLKETQKDFQHTAIDPFQTKRFKSCGVSLLREHNLNENFSLIEENSQLALPKLIEKGEKYDLIYIDGSHRYADVFVDAYFAMQLLKQEGILVFDDCSDAGVLKVIRYMDALKENYKNIDVRNFVDFKLIKKLIYPYAKALGKVQVRVYQKLK